MKNIINKLIIIAVLVFGMTACTNDLDQVPIDPDSFTENDVFANATEAKGALAKVYASLALTGQQGPAGQPDISDIDEGFSQFSRMLFNLNELTTDHAVIAWGDAGLQDLHGMYWAAGNDFSDAMYYRLAQTVSFANSFIENAQKLADDQEVKYYIAEARFIRAYAYYNLMDLYGNVPIVTVVTTELPKQNTRAEVFDFVEKELLEIQDELKESGSNEYGRVDKVAAWALLSRLYLNAESFIGSPKYDQCVVYAEKAMNATYQIDTDDANGNGSAYDEMFLADNNLNGAQNEFIFAINFDGLHSQTWGGTTFLVHAAIGGSMNAGDFGVNGGWYGLRTTKNLVNKFSVDINSLNANLGGTLSDWGLVGSATPNGWGSTDDIELYETAPNVFEIYVELLAGELKFRYNEDWGQNYGDDGADGTLDAGGANIVIPADGTYHVVMNLNDLTYSIETFHSDARAMFYTQDQNLEIEDVTNFNDGYAITKFKNVDVNGNAGSDPGGNFVDTDLALIRLAEVYLNYAEAVLRGGGGSTSVAVDKINELRERAYGNSSGNISSGDLTLDFILDERSRELYWEGLRRTDLIRYGYFTTSAYLWPFKGNDPNGIAVDSYRKLFPLPTNLLSINPNLQQNPGY